MVTGPHSRACGVRPHDHGVFCNSNCPTCKGRPFLKENHPMSDKPGANSPSDLPSVFSLTAEQIVANAKDLLEKQPPEVQQAVEKSKSFYQKNRKVIFVGAAVLVGMKINKRAVEKATAKAVEKAFDQEMPGVIDTVTAEFPTMFDIVRDLRATPGMAYIPHEGGMVHLLAAKDAVITVFGDFTKMNNDQIWDHVGKVLKIR